MPSEMGHMNLKLSIERKGRNHTVATFFSSPSQPSCFLKKPNKHGFIGLGIFCRSVSLPARQPPEPQGPPDTRLVMESSAL